MEGKLKELYEMCDTISNAIKQANEKIRTAGGKVSTGDIDYVDKLTHSLKSVKAVIKMMEEDEDMDDGYSQRGYSRNDYSGRMYRGRSYDDGYSGRRSYAPGRGTYAKRDSMGRYASDDGYSRGGDMVDELRSLMNDAPDEQTRQEFQRLINKMENR